MLFPLLLAAAVLPDAAPVIRKDVHASRFVEAVGRRSMILAREDGTFEAWINPIKILRDFRLSVYYDGALEPTPLSEIAEQVLVSPGRTAIIHSTAAFTIRQTFFAPLEKPALAVILEIDTTKPLKLRATFHPELKPMWPAAFGGQTSTYVPAEHVFVFSEGLRKHGAVLGSPGFTRASEQVGHQLPDGTVTAEMDVAAGQQQIPIILARDTTAYHETLANYEALIRESDSYYRDFDARTFHIETPVAEINAAFEWSRYAMDKGWICNDGVGCALVAGFGPSGASERPGFAWYFGGDALINSWSILDYGDHARARAVLEFVRDHQRGDGKMQHELTQSAALIDWNQYPYGYYHADTTPLFIISAARYVLRSGDREFLNQSWLAIDKAYRFCVSTLDADGLMSNAKAGAAAVETGALTGKVEKDIYLAGAWVAAVDAYARLAGLHGKGREAAEAQDRLRKARASLATWFAKDQGWFSFAILKDGSTYSAQSGWQGLALAYAHLDPALTLRATQTLSRPELSTPWGVRLFATDSAFYDPLSYNDGSVWPFVTAFVEMAQFRQHQMTAGLRNLFGSASLLGLMGAGFLPEYLSGQRAQALPRSVPHQLFSATAVLHPAVSGLLGFETNALENSLSMTPHIPRSWKSTRFSGYRAGQSMISGEIIHDESSTRIILDVQGPAMDLVINPAFPPGTRLTGIKGDQVIPISAPSNLPDIHFPVALKSCNRAEVTWLVDPGPEPAIVLAAPTVGSRAPEK